MKYVVIECSGEPMLITDNEGNVKIFDFRHEAEDEAAEHTYAIAVPLSRGLKVDDE
jgi:hypothetical protein